MLFWTLSLILSGMPLAHVDAQVRQLRGVVADSLETPISGVEVSVEGTSLRAVSDITGKFFFGSAPPGELVLSARRLGYRPARLNGVTPGPGDARLRIEMSSLPQVLKPVLVQQAKPRFTGRLAGFYERLHRKSGGYYVTQDELDRDNPRSLVGVLRKFPAVTLFRDRGGATGIRFRGRSCRPLVWLDGFPMPAGEVDLESFAPSSLHGIEMYLGFANPPARYLSTSDASRCGTILLWSRGPDTDSRFASQVVSAVPDVLSLPGGTNVFTADDVDEPALALGTRPAVTYPSSLLAQRLPGRVVAGFVIGTTGLVEAETVNIISASHPLFGEAVREASREWRFTPARKKGVVVRQWANQAFSFSPGGRSAKDILTDPGEKF